MQSIHPSQLKKSAASQWQSRRPARRFILVPQICQNSSHTGVPNSAQSYHPMHAAMSNEAYSSGKVPIQWQTALSTPIFKNGDASDPANSRPIAVGEPLCRLYANILNHRLTQYTEQQQLCTHTYKLDTDLTSVLYPTHAQRPPRMPNCVHGIIGFAPSTPPTHTYLFLASK
ncbi:TPA: hypothetical protein ACH3X1_012439 [Trebouxia sp. C0004]